MNKDNISKSDNSFIILECSSKLFYYFNTALSSISQVEMTKTQPGSVAEMIAPNSKQSVKVFNFVEEMSKLKPYMRPLFKS